VRGAEATSITFAEMGSIAADNLRAFGLQTNETARVVDVLTQTANKSNQTVLDLGESMKYAAPIARSLGLPLEDLAATMGLLANNGIRGSDAGTALRTGLTRLQIAASGSNEELEGLTRGNVLLARAMRSLGAEIIDTNGNLLPLDQVILSLRENIQGLSAGRRAEITKALFGDEAGSKFLALLNSSEGQIKTMFAAVRDSGGVAEKTQKQMQGFGYAVKVLGGNFEYLTNQVGGAIGFALKPFIDVLNAAIGAAQNLPGPIKAIGSAAAAAGITVLGLVVAIAALKSGLALLGGATAIKAAITGVLSFGGTATTATGAITGLKAAMLAIPGVGWAAAAIIGAGLLGKAAYDTNETFRNFVDNIGGVLASDFRSAVNGMAADARASAGDIDKTYKGLAKGMEPAADFIRQLFKDVFKDTSDSAQVSATQSTGAFNEFFTSLSTSATEGFAGLNTIISNWWDSLPAPIRSIFEGNAASTLAGAGQYVGGAIGRSTQSDADRLNAAGSTATYTIGGITYDTATGAPVKAPPAFVPGNAMNVRVGDTVGGGGAAGGGANTIAGIEKSIKALKELQEQAVIGSSEFQRYGAELQRLEARLKSVTGKAKELSAEDRIAAKPFGREIIAAAKANSVDPALFAALVGQESNFNQRAVSRSGAIGLSQLMPGTARELGVNPNDPLQNLMGGAKYLRQMMDRFGLEGGLRAYNQGPGAQERTPGGNSQESREYPGRVLARYEQFAGGGEGMAELQAQGLKAQTESAEKLREQKEAADELLVAERDRLEILQATDPMQKAIIESMNKGLDIEKKFNDLIKASPRQKETLELAKQYAIKSDALELERELSDLTKEAQKPLQDALKEAGDRLAYEREYGELLSQGINPELAKQFVELERIATAAKTNLELQIATLEASAAQLPIEDEKRKQLERQIELRKEQLKLIPGTVAETKGIMVTTGERTPGQDITARIGVLKNEIKGLTDIGQVAITSADNIGNAFGSAFSGLISGAMSAREALAGFFKDIAAGFIEMAAQIIAKQMTMIVLQTILKALGAVAGGGGGGGFGASGAGFGGSNSFGSFDAGGALAFGGGLSFAGGGYTGSAPRAGGIDGQGGFPAILHPQETVIDHAKIMPIPYQRSAAAAAPPAMEAPYQRSGPTMAVPFQKSAGGAAGDSTDGAITVKFETVRIGGVDYVTRDEAEQIGRESAQRGADLAHKRFRNSPSARRAAGMS
jgi:TP901 family phage tail tape measure protein